MAARKDKSPKGVIEIFEEVFHLLKIVPLRVHASYFFGSIPFVLGLLYFWADMSKSAFAYAHVARASLVMALLFVWMKCWHAIYARQLLAEVRDEQPAPWTPVQVFRAAIRQTITQPSGLFALPLALLATVPFGWVYAFYQNLTVLEDGNSAEIMSFIRKAGRLAHPWQKQNVLIIWALSPCLLIAAAAFFLVVTPIVAALTADWTGIFLGFYSVVFFLALLPLSPFGLVIAANIGAALYLLPWMFQSLTGIQVPVTLQMTGMFNSLFMAAVCGLAYLCLDPLVKAAYVLRRFYLESRTTGEDLRVGLKRVTRTVSAIVIISLSMFAMSLSISPEAIAQQDEVRTTRLGISAAELDRALESELQAPKYAWRLPRIEAAARNRAPSASFVREIANMLANWGEFILRHTQPIVRWIEDFLKWLFDRAPDFDPERRRLDEISLTLRIILYSLLAVLVSAAGVILWRTWKNRRQATPLLHAEKVVAIPDIEKETTTAADLPEDGWLALARELIERGELRLALRALFLACLALLARGDFIRIALFKTNRDYKRELERRAHAKAGILEIFSENSAIYESVWYGTYEPRSEWIDHFFTNQQKLRAYETDK